MLATFDEAVGYDGAVKAGRAARDVPARAVPITFGQCAAQWLRTKQRTKRSGTSTLYECELRCHVLPYFAHTPLVAIRRWDVQDWVDALAASGLAPATVGHCYRAVFKSVINTAVLDGLLGSARATGSSSPSRARSASTRSRRSRSPRSPGGRRPGTGR